MVEFLTKLNFSFDFFENFIFVFFFFWIKNMAKASSSDQLKSKGNEYFSKGDYKNAIIMYSDAIQLNPSNSILYSNRAFAYIKCEE